MPDRSLKDPPSAETDMVRLVGFGTVAWAVAFGVLLLFRADLEDAGRLWWLGTCAAGFGLGLVGLYVVSRRRR